MTTPNWLDTLEEKWEQRMKRYRDKKTRAEGTDIVNQGAKVKATAECLDEFRAGRRNAGREPVACEKMREAAMDVMIPLAAWKLNDEQEQYREIGPTMRATLIAAHDKLLAALFLPCSCWTVNFDRFAQLLVKHVIIDECAIYDSEGYDGGKLLDHLRLAWSELQKGGDASCQSVQSSNMNTETRPMASTGAGQSNPEPAPTPRTDAAIVWEDISLADYRRMKDTACVVRRLATMRSGEPWIYQLAIQHPREFERELAEARERYLDLCRIVLPPAPQSWGDVREAELDEAAFEKWRTSKPASNVPITQYDLREAWDAALAYAREEKKP